MNRSDGASCRHFPNEKPFKGVATGQTMAAPTTKKAIAKAKAIAKGRERDRGRARQRQRDGGGSRQTTIKIEINADVCIKY